MAQINDDVKNILNACKVTGNVVSLPPQQLDRKLYEGVKKQLELIGGKWKSGKVQGFVFEQDPKELLETLCTGEVKNLKKEFQFFATPAPLAARLVQLAEVANHHSILEPSAGDGAIIEAINRACNVRVAYCEIMELNRLKISARSYNQEWVGDDFLLLDRDDYSYDRIIANPPFAKNQDIDHIRKMYSVLKRGGRLVSIASKHWQHSTNKKEKEFSDWLYDIGADIIELDRGEFKESGTMIATCIIIIDK